VQRPELFDAVVLDADRHVREIQVKRPDATSCWIWGAFKMPAAVFHDLRRLWLERQRRDQYIGTLVNAYLAAGGAALGSRAGTAYADVGTLHGYRGALQMLAQTSAERGGIPSPRASASDANTPDRATSG
jgi:glucose-1-phosphate thymidylyltransferase